MRPRQSPSSRNRSRRIRRCGTPRPCGAPAAASGCRPTSSSARAAPASAPARRPSPQAAASSARRSCPRWRPAVARQLDRQDPQSSWPRTPLAPGARGRSSRRRHHRRHPGLEVVVLDAASATTGPMWVWQCQRRPGEAVAMQAVGAAPAVCRAKVPRPRGGLLRRQCLFPSPRPTPATLAMPLATRAGQSHVPPAGARGAWRATAVGDEPS
mmetsp:Transcript_66710/g.211060  ORF Transcript_66710/g.211060 Transcript_66710/m.211060 type:complete len:212 (-) Transcript_66710:7-642(-)